LFKIIFFIILITIAKNILKKKDKNNSKKGTLMDSSGYNANELPLDEIVFYLEDKAVSLEEIEDDFYDIFYNADDDEAVDNLFDAYYKKDIILDYDDNNKKIQISKSATNDIKSIKMYYNSGNLMYDFKIIDEFNVELSEYGDNKSLINSDRYSMRELDIIKNRIEIEERFSYGIVLLYKTLETRDLEKLIENNNRHSLPKIRKNRKGKNSIAKPSLEKKIVKTPKREIYIDNRIQDIPKVESINVENEIKSNPFEINEAPLTEHKDGPFRNYHESGALKNTGSYKNNKFHSRYVEYYINGRIKEEGNYEDGKKIGKWRYYNDRGIVEKEEEF